MTRLALPVAGFWRGFAAPFSAARSLLGLPQSWPYAAVPALVFLLLEGAMIGVSWQVLKPWVSERLSGDGALQNAGATAAAWASVALAAALGWLISAFLTPPLSSPALERVVALVEHELKAPERVPLGFVAELGCGVRSLLLGGAITLPIVVGLTLLEVLFAPLAVVTTPLKLLIGALGIAWGLFDYPLTLRGVGARRRLGFVKRHLSVVLGFGLAFALVFWLPCCGIVMLPVGVAAATRLVWELESSGAGS